MLLASAIVGAMWLDPAGVSTPTAERLLGFVLFLVIGGIQVWLLRMVDRVVQRIRENERQLNMINGELKHRMKNVFALADSIFRQSLKSGGTPEELRHGVSSRLQAIAAAQDLMSVVAADGSTIEALIEAVVAPLAPHPARLVTKGPAARLPADTTTPFALMLHELATNATKHGAWRGDTGIVVITWRQVQDGAAPLLHLEWKEEGGPAVAPSGRKGFGSLLLRTGLPGARVAHELHQAGLRCRLELPAVPPPQAGAGEHQPRPASAIF